MRVQLLFDKDADTRKAPAISQSAGFGWDLEKKGRAFWNPESSARYYQVQLIHNGGAVGIVRSVYQNYYDFSEQVTEPGAYQFQVRTVSAASHSKSEWTVSDVLTVKTDGSFVVAEEYAGAGWQKTADGLRWWWRNEDGTWPSPMDGTGGPVVLFLMTRAIWLQDGSVWTVSGIIWIGKMEICT